MRSEVFELQANLEERHWWFVGRRNILQAVIAAITPPGTGGTVIDIGSGTGGNLRSLAGNYRVLGLEPSGAALAIARPRYPEVEFFEGSDPAVFASTGDSRSIFLLADVLEHVPDDVRVFSELVAIMPPGSHVLLTVPAEEALWSPHDVALYHYRRYEVDRFRILWRDLPIRERLLTPFNARLYPVVRLLRAIARRRGTSRGSAGTDLGMPLAAANRMLTRLFAGERVRILRALASGRGPAFRRGVSLLAVLERLPGPAIPRGRPREVPLDRHVPGVG